MKNPNKIGKAGIQSALSPVGLAKHIVTKGGATTVRLLAFKKVKTAFTPRKVYQKGIDSSSNPVVLERSEGFGLYSSLGDTANPMNFPDLPSLIQAEIQ